MNIQPVAQKTAPKIVKLPIKTEKEKDTKMPPSRSIHQPQKGTVMPPEILILPIIMPLSARLPPKPPNVNDAIASIGLDPNVDIEENTPHQEGIITETYVAPNQSYLEQPQELIKLVNISKVVQWYFP